MRFCYCRLQLLLPLQDQQSSDEVAMAAVTMLTQHLVRDTACQLGRQLVA